MIKTPTTHENSSSAPSKVVTNGKSPIISPVNEEDREERFQAALKKININHGETLRKLGE